MAKPKPTEDQVPFQFLCTKSFVERLKRAAKRRLAGSASVYARQTLDADMRRVEAEAEAEGNEG